MKRSPMKASTKPMSRGKPIRVKFKTRKSDTPLSEEKAHKSALALLGCAACFRLYGPHEPGEVELHHLRGGGWGKGDYKTLIPLCVEHHRGNTGVHGLGVKGFDKHYGFTQADLLAWAIEQLNTKG